ncbi:MAG: FAD-dependent monooxygenase [Alteromonadaceae bacterium]|nr:FAD-dependent monooxygenase [Alteromonadaceae bacterium]
MQKFDILIVGGGMVGLTLALAIRKQSSLTVAIAEPSPISELNTAPEVRVSAINIASYNIFNNLDVWPLIQNQRIQAYQHMHIWDKAGYGHLDFSLDDKHENTSSEQSAQLGWIIENKVIRNALWQKAMVDEGITFFTDEIISNIGIGDSEVFVSFNPPFSTTRDASQVPPSLPIITKLVVGADGANSWVRKQMDMAMSFRDYDHHAIVATVRCTQGHQNTAWQVFLPTGPLAFLPLFQKDLCSIVWSTSPQEAKRLTQLSAVDFGKEITAASDGKLGTIHLESDCTSYPLTMRLVQDFVKERVVLVGDAAHTIHPLAGQGVNLGLLDAVALAQTLVEPLQKQFELAPTAWLNNKSLKSYARWRKSDATEMVAAMEAIKQTFSPQNEASKLIRGIGLSLLNNFKPVKNMMIKRALGFRDNLPVFAEKQE